MQADTVSLAARGWGSGARAGSGRSPTPDAEAARSLLAGWDGDLAAGSAAALLYACFQRALAGRAVPAGARRRTTWEWVASGALAPTTSMVRRWLGQRHLGAARRAGAPTGRAMQATRSERSERVLAAVPGRAGRGVGRRPCTAGGPDPGQWRWGDVHQAVRVHPLAAAARFAGVPMGGDADTIQAAGYGWRAGSPFTVLSLSVYRQVVDLASA